MLKERDFDGLVYYKAVEIVFSVSLTVNLCVLFYAALPWIFNRVRRNIFKKADDESNISIHLNRMSSSVPFYIIFPVCGLVLLFTSDVLRNPFFAYNRSLCIVFSSALGQYIYKSAESVYWRKETNYRPVLVHHSVVIAIYTVVLCYEQCALIGLIGLLVKGSFVFAEFDNESFSKPIRKRQWSVPLKVIFVGLFAASVILKGFLPGLLVVYSIVTSSEDLLKMQYIPLAFLFLSLVFFAAVVGWFFKDAFCELRHILGRSKPKYLYNLKQQPLTTLINHNGLEKLMVKENGTGTLHIKCNDLWDKEFASAYSKLKNIEVIEVECATPSVLKSTNITAMP